MTKNLYHRGRIMVFFLHRSRNWRAVCSSPNALEFTKLHIKLLKFLGVIPPDSLPLAALSPDAWEWKGIEGKGVVARTEMGGAGRKRTRICPCLDEILDTSLMQYGNFVMQCKVTYLVTHQSFKKLNQTCGVW